MTEKEYKVEWDRIMAAVDSEEELDGPMPEVMRSAIVNAIAAGDWQAIEEHFRSNLRVAKRNIKARIEAALRPDNGAVSAEQALNYKPEPAAQSSPEQLVVHPV